MCAIEKAQETWYAWLPGFCILSEQLEVRTLSWGMTDSIVGIAFFLYNKH